MRWLVSVVACFASAAVGFGQIEVWQKQLEANPRDALAHLRVGEIFLSQNNYQAAATEFRSAILGEAPADWVVEIARKHLQMIAVLTRSGGTSLQPLPAPTRPTSAARVQAEYSDEARLAGLEGIVIVSGTPGEEGALRDLRIERPLGLGLDEKALEAVRQWRHSGEPLAPNALVRVEAEFVLPEKKSRWHLTSVQFRPPEGVSRPVFARVPYPIGSGIAREAVDQGRFVIAVGRSAVATVSFDLGPNGKPSNFRIVSQSEETWGPQAVGLLSQWEFLPGTKDGIPVTVPCVFTLVWGERSIPAQVLSHAGESREPVTTENNAPAILHRVEPAYPREALAAKRQGTVTVALSVAPDGTPKDLRVIEKLGYGFDESALEAVAQWRFAPVTINGQAVQMPAIVAVPFRLQ